LVRRLRELMEVRARLASQGMTPGGGPPEFFAAFLRQQMEKWRKAAKAGNIEPREMMQRGRCA